MSNYTDFSQIITKIRGLTKLPYDGRGSERGDETSHLVDGESHRLRNYEEVLYNNQPFEVVQRWSYCAECAKVVTAYVVGFDNKEHEYYKKDFVKKGEKKDYTSKILKSFSDEVKVYRGGDE